MPVNKVWIEDGCTACGICKTICPEVFEVEEVAVVKKDANFSEFEEEIKDAADNCPVDVIKYE